MWLVVGLGNPGPAYARTRHNVGFAVVHRLLERVGGLALRPAVGGLVGSGQLAGVPVTFCQPMTYMNRSGGPVGDLAHALGLSSDRVLVVHDDLDLDFGAVRCKRRGGHGGHNGLRDIARRLGREHPRIRFGIGRPPPNVAVAGHVLGAWSSAEASQISARIEHAADAVEVAVRDGLDAAMNQFNVRSASAGGHPQRKTTTTSHEVGEQT